MNNQASEARKTAQSIAATIPCACSNCGMNEPVATMMIKEYADQELAAYREEIETTAFETNLYVIMLREENRKLREALKELIPIAEWKLQSTLNYLNDFKETTITEPEKYKEADKLKSLIDKSKTLIDSYTDKEKQ